VLGAFSCQQSSVLHFHLATAAEHEVYHSTELNSNSRWPFLLRAGILLQGCFLYLRSSCHREVLRLGRQREVR
jgi:hypothetical protein